MSSNEAEAVRIRLTDHEAMTIAPDGMSVHERSFATSKGNDAAATGNAGYKEQGFTDDLGAPA
jgi:hypothetical protein